MEVTEIDAMKIIVDNRINEKENRHACIRALEIIRMHHQPALDGWWKSRVLSIVSLFHLRLARSIS